MTPTERKAKVVGLAEYINIRTARLAAMDRTKPSVPIVLGGKEYTLELTNRAVKAVFVATAYNILTGGVTGDALNDPIVYGCLLHNALLKHHPELTEEGVDEMADYPSTIYIQSCLAQAGKLFMPDMTDLEYERVKPAATDSAEDPT